MMYVMKANAIIVSKATIKWLVRLCVHLLFVPFWYQHKPIFMFDDQVNQIPRYSIEWLHKLCTYPTNPPNNVHLIQSHFWGGVLSKFFFLIFKFGFKFVPKHIIQSQPRFNIVILPYKYKILYLKKISLNKDHESRGSHLPLGPLFPPSVCVVMIHNNPFGSAIFGEVFEHDWSKS